MPHHNVNWLGPKFTTLSKRVSISTVPAAGQATRTNLATVIFLPDTDSFDDFASSFINEKRRLPLIILNSSVLNGFKDINIGLLPRFLGIPKNLTSPNLFVVQKIPLLLTYEKFLSYENA